MVTRSAKNGWCSVKPLDDPQLRAKLIRASSDMPHVNLWAKIQSEAGDIAQTAQGRATRTRFSLFSGLQLLAPALVVLLVFGTTLLSLTDEPTSQRRPAPVASSSQSVTAALPTTASDTLADDTTRRAANLAYDRWLARDADRLDGPAHRQNGPQLEVVDTGQARDLESSAPTQAETRDDLRAEWREYLPRKQRPSSSSALQLIRPFVSTMTPQ